MCTSTVQWWWFGLGIAGDSEWSVVPRRRRRLRIVTARVRGLRNPGAGLSARHERSVGNREFSFLSASFLEAVLGDYSSGKFRHHNHTNGLTEEARRPTEPNGKMLSSGMYRRYHCCFAWGEVDSTMLKNALQNE